MDEAEPPRRKRASDIRAEEMLGAQAAAGEAVRRQVGIGLEFRAGVILRVQAELNGSDSRSRMAYFDKLPKPMRDIANEYGDELVRVALAHGVNDPNVVRAIAEAARRENAAESEEIYTRMPNRRRTRH